ncbi:N-acetyltransferase [Aestuariicella hydrocarbonica]|uniref:N-acetyltransferase n=1 Tax=Pseudomaricurvus hydrocarbonicus TaxID=1470433 RepID=A0A9E5T4K2_9GAMM|nr:GNAT family N-acetyltransferase [Aestuariicella hydrocarbonica]NHO68208.1 N-acetyltransferase [Aestuariicella hydrocarbonica]
MPELTLIHSIHEIDANAWDALWLSQNQHRYPFIRHGFLAALEDSGCTDTESGWTPRHLLIHQQGTLIGAMPLYLKHHSYGEYVFDWAWADAYRRNGLEYYPKLLCAIPFTPATGPRLALDQAALTAFNLTPGDLYQQVTEFLSLSCQQQQWSGWHCLFHPGDENPLWQQASAPGSGPLQRTGCQFHWFNRGQEGGQYQDFDDFLSMFNSRKRKSVRKERRQVKDRGVTLTRLVGDQISAEDWDKFYYFYHTTYLKRSGNTGYLNREFFDAIARDMGDQILMVKAELQQADGQHNIASALCFFDDTHLYGRYWGCREDIPGLHFEACYYQGIEFAIERGLQVFDPGAQGEHKIQRGFEPTLTYSQHWLTDPRFHAAVDDFLQRETPGVEAYRDDCDTYLPFKRG